MLRFLIDEDLPRSLENVFKQYGYEAVHVLSAGLRGKSDAEIAEFARQNGLCLITGDLGFANIRDYPPAEYPGFVVLRIPSVAGSNWIRRVVEEWLLSGYAEQAAHCLTIVEPGRVRLRGG